MKETKKMFLFFMPSIILISWLIISLPVFNFVESNGLRLLLVSNLIVLTVCSTVAYLSKKEKAWLDLIVPWTVTILVLNITVLKYDSLIDSQWLSFFFSFLFLGIIFFIRTIKKIPLNFYLVHLFFIIIIFGFVGDEYIRALASTY